MEIMRKIVWLEIATNHVSIFLFTLSTLGLFTARRAFVFFIDGVSLG